MMTIPSNSQWKYSDPIGWDEETAMENFMGISLEAAFHKISESSHYYQEDFYYMPKVPFQYYLQAYMDYLISDQSKGDSDGASCFLSLIEFVLAEETEYEGFLSGIKEKLDNCLEYVSHKQQWYDAPVEIYGNFHNKIGRLRKDLVYAK